MKQGVIATHHHAMPAAVPNPKLQLRSSRRRLRNLPLCRVHFSAMQQIQWWTEIDGDGSEAQVSTQHADPRSSHAAVLTLTCTVEWPCLLLLLLKVTFRAECAVGLNSKRKDSDKKRIIPICKVLIGIRNRHYKIANRGLRTLMNIVNALTAGSLQIVNRCFKALHFDNYGTCKRDCRMSMAFHMTRWCSFCSYLWTAGSAPIMLQTIQAGNH